MSAEVHVAEEHFLRALVAKCPCLAPRPSLGYCVADDSRTSLEYGRPLSCRARSYPRSEHVDPKPFRYWEPRACCRSPAAHRRRLAGRLRICRTRRPHRIMKLRSVRKSSLTSASRLSTSSTRKMPGHPSRAFSSQEAVDVAAAAGVAGAADEAAAAEVAAAAAAAVVTAAGRGVRAASAKRGPHFPITANADRHGRV